MQRLNKIILTAVLLAPMACSSDNGKTGPDVKPVVPPVQKETGIEIGKVLPAWQKGEMDIHFINTTTGECAFLIMPDGTQMLIDAASSLISTNSNGSTTNTGIRSRWDPTKTGTRGSMLIANYLKKCMAWTGNGTIDYIVNTHLHNDHFGDCNSSLPVSGNSSTYRLNGIPEILDLFPVSKVVDRGWPSYDYPFDMQTLASNKAAVKNYVNAVKWHVENKGLKAELFKAGVTNQIVPRTSEYDVTVRNIAVNGEIWTGNGTDTKKTFPEKKDIVVANPAKIAGTDNCPAENICSCVMKVSYGNFDFFAGGDLQYNNRSNFSWKDAELPCAKAAGRVEVMKADHHGSEATNSPETLTILSPQVIVVNSWVDVHPRTSVMASMEKTLPAMDLFITNFCRVERPSGVDDKVTEAEASRVKGYDGNIVIRVVDGGKKYYVVTTTDSDGQMTVKNISGPYNSR